MRSKAWQDFAKGLWNIVFINRSDELPERVVNAEVVSIQAVMTSGGVVWNCPLRM